MTTSPSENTAQPVADRLFAAMVDGMDVLAGAIGDRLGYYRALDGAALTPEGLIQKADQAMYRVKERDKNGIEVAV